MDIQDIISRKRALLKAAQKKVAELQQQIATLETLAAEDAVDVALASKIEPSEHPAQATKTTTSTVSSVEDAAQKQTTQLKATSGGKNPKGSVRQAILGILSDGEERDLDYIDNLLQILVPVSVSRGALRNTLMTLRQDGLIYSRKPGYYNITQKGESPAATGLSGATMSPPGQATFRA